MSGLGKVNSGLLYQVEMRKSDSVEDIRYYRHSEFIGINAVVKSALIFNCNNDTFVEKYVNLIILAARTGRRLYPLTKDTPKSLLDLGDGDTLLDRQLEIAAMHDEIDKVYVISGYRTEQIEV